MLKKIIAVLLILCLSLPVCALAQQDPKPIATCAPQDIPKTPEGVHHYLLLCADTIDEFLETGDVTTLTDADLQ